jgi:hypothetical protein
LSLVALVTDRALALSNAAILGAVWRRVYDMHKRRRQRRKESHIAGLLTFAREDLDDPREPRTVGPSPMGFTSEVMTTPYDLTLHGRRLHPKRWVRGMRRTTKMGHHLGGRNMIVLDDLHICAIRPRRQACSCVPSSLTSTQSRSHLELIATLGERRFNSESVRSGRSIEIPRRIINQHVSQSQGMFSRLTTAGSLADPTCLQTLTGKEVTSCPVALC